MTREEEYQRLIENRDELEQELDYIEDQIRLGHANEEDEDHYMNELQNQIMYIEACIRSDFDDLDD